MQISEKRKAELVTVIRYYAAATQWHFGWSLVSDWLDDDIAEAIGNADNVITALQKVRVWVNILHRHELLLDHRNWKGNA